MAWVFKTEPAECSIDDIAAAGVNGVLWEGVRNYQARNFLRDVVKIGDLVLIHHSSCDLVGVVGLAEIVNTGIIDPSQFDAHSSYYDVKSDTKSPRWVAVQVRFVRKFSRVLTLATLREYPALANMQLLRKGNRLSVMPLTDAELACVVTLADN